MYKTIKLGHILSVDGTRIKSNIQVTYTSKLWKCWQTTITMGTCYYCASMHGRILSLDDVQALHIPVHDNCKCRIESITAIVAGTATDDGQNGVDYYMALYGVLPDNYVTKEGAKDAGWIAMLGNLQDALPESIIGGDIYYNRDKRLPEATGRIWYEADFNYDGGFRNGCRLLYSNDGLLFITYDHYFTFNEIGLEHIK